MYVRIIHVKNNLYVRMDSPIYLLLATTTAARFIPLLLLAISTIRRIYRARARVDWFAQAEIASIH